MPLLSIKSLNPIIGALFISACVAPLWVSNIESFLSGYLIGITLTLLLAVPYIKKACE